MVDVGQVSGRLQAHPHLPVLATSGIETVVRLWAPTGEAGDPEAEDEPLALAERNQERMHEGPQLLRGINPRVLMALTENPQLLDVLLRRAVRADAGDAPVDETPPEIDCRVN